MSPKLPRLSGDDVQRALGRAGFFKASQRGSHVKMRHADGRTAIVPMHPELRSGTLKSVLRQANLSTEELRALLSQ
jgi:predicted RNA binding protein YcfA (HicA-like mRNA interferase family)